MSAPEPLRSATRRQRRREALLAAGAITYPDVLPISERADELVAAIAANQVLIVAGETGSGKSTQLPKLCLQAGRGANGLIGHTQPRRVAARTIAERVADELGTTIGDAVGYSVRFNDRVGADTVVKVMTDGILLAEIQRDCMLRRYDTLIIDEAHERSLNIDFILGYLKQLLPRRPDLSVIVTSATIDTARFAAHFAAADGTPATVVEVSGRTYPVEIRYRPLDADSATDERSGDTAPPNRRDQVQAISDAVAELEAEGPGDILVFLSGEREIHDTADALRRVADARARPLEVLPMYARLSAAEQQRIFRPGAQGHRRVVLSTNVAETSLTVPGIRYVVDTGLARISRYSRRLKVQRLPIEAISQASANQRSGRCGRVAPGIAIRLYAEDDFAQRDEFTEPEILRTNLAAVILQMTAIGLGDVAAFPFVEAPDSATIGDGHRLLDELGALHRRDGDAVARLTSVGRTLARLPVDPRLGRMIVEAERRDCVREVLVIAAALSIQDPRERPLDKQQQADEFHRRFVVEGSDLLGIVALWDYLRQQQRQLSSNQFRRLCQREFLHYVRVREWHDLFSQLRQIAGELGIRPGTVNAHPDHVHQAVLAGLLSHLGMRDGERREYRGARASSFVIGRGSALAKRPPRWVMAAELVETERIFARRVATIQPQWAEQLAEHLVKRSYGEARWERSGGRAVTVETVTLFGLPIVAGRTIGLDRIDPETARHLLIREVFVEPADDDDDTSSGRGGAATVVHDGFLADNARFRADVEALEARLRNHGLLDHQTVFDAYDRRLPDHVTTVAAFNKWWRTARRADPRLLDLTVDDLRDPSGAAISLDDYPDDWAVGELRLPLSYRDDDSPFDGVTVELDVATLNQLDSAGFDWQIPGYRPALIDALARSLPKSIRRQLIPMAETLAAAAARLVLVEPDTAVVDAFAAALTAVSGVAVEASDFDTTVLPTHLRVHFTVRDDSGAVVDGGDDLTALRRRLAGTARAAIAAAVAIDERAGMVTWDVGDLPAVVSAHRGGAVVRGFPALVDDGDSVSLRVFSTAAVQQRVMRGGVRRLLLLGHLPSTRAAERGIDTAAAFAAGTALAELAEQCAMAAVDAIARRRAVPFTAAAFGALAADVDARAGGLAAAALPHAVAAATAGRDVRRRLAELTAPSLLTTSADATRQLERLTGGRFVVRAGLDRIADVVRYLRALDHRLQRIGGNVGADREKLAAISELERRYTAYLDSLDGTAAPAAVEVGWQLEELRVVTFAQQLGVRGNVSATRIGRQLTELEGA